MSFLSDLKNRRITATQFLGKSAGYLLQIAKGALPSDDKVTAIAAKAEADAATAAGAAQAAFAVYIRTHYPLLPAEIIATQAATLGLHLIDAAISGAANVVKANNVDAAQPQAA